MRPIRGFRSMGGWLLVLAAVVGCGSGHAASKTWDGGGGTKDWFTPENWNDDGCPEANDDVLLDNGASVVLSESPPALNSLTLTNSLLVFSNWTTTLTATTIVIQGLGVISNPPAFTDEQMSNRIYLVCNRFTLEQGGLITVRGCGYRGGVSYTDAVGKLAHGPGKGLIAGTYYGGAGGYGGWGGDSSLGSGGNEYGSLTSPTDPGSGGAGQGGSGGGAVRIEAAQSATVHGIINADGIPIDWYSGPGSGGSIFITCRTFHGSGAGLLTAAGGDGPRYQSGSGCGGSAGGGRIAVVYDSEAQAAEPRPDVRFSVANGRKRYPWSNTEEGWIGTLYLPDARLLSEAPTNFLNVRLFLGSETNWSADSLQLIQARLGFGADAFVVSVAGGIVCDGPDSGLSFFGGHSQLRCGGDLTLTNGAAFHMAAGLTNDATPEYGALVELGGDMLVNTGSWVYPAPVMSTNHALNLSRLTNGAIGAVLFRMRMLKVAEGGGFNAAGQGFVGGTTLGGFGPGRASGAVQYYGGGGGHGGKGATASTAGGVVNDGQYAPLFPGSGGVGWDGNARSAGGGVIRIEASSRIVLDGVLNANAFHPNAGYCGGAAGGSVFLRTPRLSGGTNSGIYANGSNAGGGYNGASGAGGGGGGRIAVWLGTVRPEEESLLRQDILPGSATELSVLDAFGGVLSATNGVHPVLTTRAGDPGTVALLQFPMRNGGSLLLIK